MIIPDVNLLIYGYDPLSKSHPEARQWWQSTLNAAEPVGIPWIVVLAFVRLATHPIICKNPMSVIQARRAVDSWFDLDHVRLLSPGKRTLDLFFHLLEQVNTGGNLTTDAMIAALAIEHGGDVRSTDSDFSRFPGLRWQNPLR
jgi:toxin-antitoxin system PIN domain toxin